MNLLSKIESKWYNFYFYDAYFQFERKKFFRRIRDDIRYTNIIEIKSKVVTVNFMPCYTFTLILEGKKKVDIVANFKPQLEVVDKALSIIKSKRTDMLMKEYNEKNNSQNKD